MSAHTTEITGDNFKAALERPGILVLDFWASWCGPCRAFAPIFEAAAQKHADVVFGKVDTDAQQELAGAFGITAIPTLIVFRDGILLFERPGVLPGNALDERVGKIQALDMDDVRQKIAEHEAAGGHAHGPGHGHDHDHHDHDGHDHD